MRRLEQQEPIVEIDLPGLLKLATELPKVSKDDPRVIAWKEAQAAGLEGKMPKYKARNNFSLLFWGRTMRIDHPNDAVVTTYLGRAEQLPEWHIFTANNEGLLKTIDAELLAARPYDMLSGAYINLLFQQRADLAEMLDKATDHPWGITAIGIAVMDRLELLLDEAEEKMEEVGMEPKDFFQ